jgi:nicotinamide-nucleotide adenylyltransferase
MEMDSFKAKGSRKKYKAGIFVGRFQPMHIGHMYTITEALKLCELLYVGIGSANESGTENNPLTAEARREILEAAIRCEGIDSRRVKLLMIPDFMDDGKWFGYIRSNCRNLSVMFTDNPWCIRICEKEKVAVETPLYKRDCVSATNMRALMADGGDWQALAPRGTECLIERHMPEIRCALKRRD